MSLSPSYHIDALYQAPSTPEDGASVGEPLPMNLAKGEGGNALQDLVETFYRGRWIVLAVFLLVMSGVGAYLVIVPPQYEAYSLVLVDTSPSSGSQEAQSFGYLDGAQIGRRSLANQALILQQSLLIAERTAERLVGMQTIPGTGERIALLDVEGERPAITALAERLQEDYVRIQPESEEVDALRITAYSPRPYQATLIANLYAQEYVNLTRETSRQRMASSRTFLEHQLSTRRAELEQLEQEISDYMSSRQAVALDEEAQALVSQIAELEAALDEARIEQRMREASLRSLEEELEQIHPKLKQRIASGVEEDIETSQTKIAELELLVEQVQFRNPNLKEDNPRAEELNSLQAQIARLKDRVQRLSDQYVDEVIAIGGVDPETGEGSGLAYAGQLQRQMAEERIAVSGAQAKVAALEERLSSYTQKLRTIPEQTIQLAQLQRARQSTEQLYTRLKEKLQEIRMAEGSEIGYAEIIRPALAPDDPSLPLGRTLALGVFLGLLLGAGGALLRERYDTRIYTPGDLRARGIDLLAAIPSERAPTEQTRSSSVVEAYQRLRLNLQLSRFGANVRSILLTSPHRNERQSTVAINLAIQMARAGRRTLIVDADLHHPRLHEHLDLAPRPGLRALLLKRKVTALNVDNFATKVDNLYALADREPIADAAELVDPDKARDLLRQFRSAFDVIIFDASPVLSTTYPVLLSTLCDATMVVVSAGATNASALTEAIETLRSVGAAVVGTVLNDVASPSRLVSRTAAWLRAAGAAGK